MIKTKTPLFLALCMALILAALPASVLADAPVYTLMIYLCGTDLETEYGAASADIREMLAANLPKGGPVQVVIETGGTRDWSYRGIDETKNERWVVSGQDLVRVDQRARQNMGDAQTLQAFVEFCARQYPADRYGLILWDHGGGSASGICWDEYTDDCLMNDEVYAALQGACGAIDGLHFDFIGFDACLMAGFEMANHVKPFADYMIASEEVMPGYGFAYDRFLSFLKRDTSVATETLLREMADAFIEATLREEPDESLTISVLNLAHMDALTEQVERMGAGLAGALDSGALRTISRSRQNMRSFGDFMRGESSDMVDLLYFAEVFAETSGGDLSAFRRALGDVVAYNRYTEKNLDNVCGIAILAPQTTSEFFGEYVGSYDRLSLYPAYTGFLRAYTDLLNGGNYVFSAGHPTQVDAQTAANAFAGTQGSGWTVTGRESEPATWEDAEDAQWADGLLVYSLTLSNADMDNLAYVEGNLMIDISDPDMEMYIDLGYLRDTVVDWERNTVYSAFDGTWPTLEGQLVTITDQTVTEKTRRSLVDAYVNGESTYLLVIYDEDRPHGEVIGHTEGYTESGLPVRGYHHFAVGDEIIPQYFLLYWDEYDEMAYEIFEGDPIYYTGQTLSMEQYSLVGEELDYAYAFCLNDIFGDYQFSDFVFFTM